MPARSCTRTPYTDARPAETTRRGTPCVCCSARRTRRAVTGENGPGASGGHRTSTHVRRGIDGAGSRAEALLTVDCATTLSSVDVAVALIRGARRGEPGATVGVDLHHARAEAVIDATVHAPAPADWDTGPDPDAASRAARWAPDQARRLCPRWTTRRPLTRLLAAHTPPPPHSFSREE